MVDTLLGIIIEFRFLQAENIPFPIVVTPSLIMTVVKPEHILNTYSPKVMLLGTVMVVKPSQQEYLQVFYYQLFAY